MNVVELIRQAPLLSQPPLAIAVDVIVLVAVVVVVSAVVIDFRAYHRQSAAVVKSDRSLVETGSMSAFFVAYYLVVRFGLLSVRLPEVARLGTIDLGLALVVTGTIFNVWGRMVLKSSWANQIKIYEGQRLLTNGPFAVVRHPLYASLIWMAVGGSLIYENPLSLAMTLGIFVPMMLARARKEDSLLMDAFGSDFVEYRSRTGMFLPRVGGRKWRT